MIHGNVLCRGDQEFAQECLDRVLEEHSDFFSAQDWKIPPHLVSHEIANVVVWGWEGETRAEVNDG